MREDDAGKRVDIEDGLRDAEPPHQGLVHDAVIGIEQQDPAEQHGQRRQEERDPHQIIDQPLSRQIGARDQPRDHYRQRQGNTSVATVRVTVFTTDGNIPA